METSDSILEITRNIADSEMYTNISIYRARTHYNSGVVGLVRGGTAYGTFFRVFSGYQDFIANIINFNFVLN